MPRLIWSLRCLLFKASLQGIVVVPVMALQPYVIKAIILKTAAQTKKNIYILGIIPKCNPSVGCFYILRTSKEGKKKPKVTFHTIIIYSLNLMFFLN
ncbi:hypothetical protein AB4K20DRAFT_1891417, partial [Rhizopus microsporus]